MDGNQYKASVTGRDAKTDIALLKINAKHDLPVAPLGDSDEVKVGQWVMTIGDPFGFDHTVTAGIISARGRFIPGNYDEFLQTDAAINPGNSGGPLINIRGEVVGVNSAIFTRTGSNTGIGFAIPVNLVKEELPQLREHGKVVRGWLGIYVQRVTPAIADSMGLEEPRGALVAEVLNEGPAKSAGVKRGDVIAAYNGIPIEDSRELPLMVARTPLGHSATLRVIRDKKYLELPVTITASREAHLVRGPQTADQGYRRRSASASKISTPNSRTTWASARARAWWCIRCSPAARPTRPACARATSSWRSTAMASAMLTPTSVRSSLAAARRCCS